MKRAILASAFLLCSACGLYAQFPGTFSPTIIAAPAVACTWHNLINPVTVTSSGSGFANYNFRDYIPTSLYLSSPPSGSRSFRVSIKASSVTSTVNLLYIGHSITNQYTFDGTQVQGFFIGSASTSISANATVVSDPITYAFDNTKNLIVSIGWGTTSITSNTATGNALVYTRAASYSSSAGANTISAIDFGPASGQFFLVPLVEICF